MKYMSTVIVAILILCIVGILVIAGLSELSPREYLFLSILLTGLAIVASWLATSLASKSSSEQMRETLKAEYMENLRTYALKAAEKVQNLSMEMERLIDYVKGSTPSEEEGDVKMAAERLKTVALMLETIKSVNDTALSDWRGIIGEELKKQEQIETDIEAIFSKIEDLEEATTAPTVTTMLGEQPWLPSTGALAAAVDWETIYKGTLHPGLENIDEDIQRYASSSPIPVRMPRRRKIEALIKCPKCESEKQTRVTLRAGYQKIARCGNCRNYFTIKVDSDLNISTDSIGTKDTIVKCVLCDEEHTVTFPIWPGYVFHHSCPKCHSVIYANVSADEELKHRQSENISKKFLDILEQMVEGKYPSIDNISAIATEFGISKAKVTQGITVLVNLNRIEGPEEEEGSEQVEERE